MAFPSPSPLPRPWLRSRGNPGASDKDLPTRTVTPRLPTLPAAASAADSPPQPTAPVARVLRPVVRKAHARSCRSAAHAVPAFEERSVSLVHSWLSGVRRRGACGRVRRSRSLAPAACAAAALAAPAPRVEDLVAEAMANAPSIAARRARLAAAQAALPASAAVLTIRWSSSSTATPAFRSRRSGRTRCRWPARACGSRSSPKGRKDARRAIAEAEIGQRHAETDAARVRPDCRHSRAVRAALRGRPRARRPRGRRMKSRSCSARRPRPATRREPPTRRRCSARSSSRRVSASASPISRVSGRSSWRRSTGSSAESRPEPFGEVVGLPEPPPLPDVDRRSAGSRRRPRRRR